MRRNGVTTSALAPWWFSYHIYYIVSYLHRNFLTDGYVVFLSLLHIISYPQTMSAYDFFFVSLLPLSPSWILYLLPLSSCWIWLLICLIQHWPYFQHIFLKDSFFFKYLKFHYVVKNGNMHLTGSSPRCPPRSNYLVHSKNNSYFIVIGPIRDIDNIRILIPVYFVCKFDQRQV